jgi:ankyrin repeat protein
LYLRKYKTALYISTDNEHHDIIRLLIENGAEKDGEEETGCVPLICAIKNNSVDTVKLLVEMGVSTNVNDRKGTPALQLAREQGEDMASALQVPSKSKA